MAVVEKAFGLRYSQIPFETELHYEYTIIVVKIERITVPYFAVSK